MDNKKPLEVKYGTIYTREGIGIDNMGVIISRDTGLYKYGDSQWVEKCYDETTAKLRKAGMNEMADSFIFIKFDRYDGVLSIEEICTLTNYMILCSSNAEILLAMLNLNEKNLKSEIKKLQDIGY